MKTQILGLRGLEWAQIVIDRLELETEDTCFQDPAWMVSQWEQNLHQLLPTVQLMEGVREFLTGLSHIERGDTKTESEEKEESEESESFSFSFKMAIATSSNHHSVAVKRTYHTWLFDQMDHVICGDDPELVAGKPSPDIYLLAASRLHLLPSQCIAFEDSVSGCQSAYEAGCYVIAIPDMRILATSPQEGNQDLLHPSLQAFQPYTHQIVTSFSDIRLPTSPPWETIKSMSK